MPRLWAVWAGVASVRLLKSWHQNRGIVASGTGLAVR